MKFADEMRTFTAVEVIGSASVRLAWSEGVVIDLDMGAVLRDRGFAALRDPAAFAAAGVGDWGHGLASPSGAELGADRLWLETLRATGHGDARAFLEWRLRHGLSLSKAAVALGGVAADGDLHPHGEKTVPEAILLACRGLEVGVEQPEAAWSR